LKRKSVKLSDYVADFLFSKGVRCVFGVTGGAVVHLLDSASRRRGMGVVFTHHEQAAAFAAQAYAKTREGVGAAFFTTGPGGTNAITGLAAAWLDSVPCIYVSGQARRAHTTDGLPVRQIGAQQLDIVRLVTPLTKNAVMLDRPESIRFELEKAYHLATSGRPGPVWIDIPLDFQWAMVNPSKLRSFRGDRQNDERREAVAFAAARKVAAALQKSRKPLFLAGGGVRNSGAAKDFARLVKTTGTPFLTTWNATDIVPTTQPECLGRPGMLGQRGANLAPSACDLLVSVGTHVPMTISGTRKEVFAPQAKRMVVNVDPDELAHLQIPHHDRLCCDAAPFLRNLAAILAARGWKAPDDWRRHCREIKLLNEPESRSPDPKRFVDPYRMVTTVCGLLRPGDSVVIDGGGTIDQIAFQSLICGADQRVVISAALCSMGSGLPESVGVAMARHRGKVVLFCGDGSFQFNIQELQTIRDHRLPVKIFIINNSGYLSIRHTQRGFLEGRFVGSSRKGGLNLPDFQKVAAAYGIPACRVADERRLPAAVRRVMDSKGPSLCEVMVAPGMNVVPRVGFERLANGSFRARPFDDMMPFLVRRERERLLSGSPSPSPKK
jgi:acetolactate synthase-1/2/3 large subunit